MASPDLHTPWLSSADESFGGSFNIRIKEEETIDCIELLEDPRSPARNLPNIPKPPPAPGKICSRATDIGRLANSDFVPKETKDIWHKLFKEGYGSDVHIITEDGSFIPAHYALLSVASPVLGNFAAAIPSKEWC